MNEVKVAVGILFFTTCATLADPITSGQPGYLAVIREGGGGVCHIHNCISPSVGIPHSYFATAADLAAQTAAQNTANKKAFEAASVAAAMQDAIPNPGDRFALRFGGSDIGGEFAGSIGASLNFNETTRLSINLGQSENITAVSGGINFSFK